MIVSWYLNIVQFVNGFVVASRFRFCAGKHFAALVEGNQRRYFGGLCRKTGGGFASVIFAVQSEIVGSR